MILLFQKFAKNGLHAQIRSLGELGLLRELNILSTSLK